MSRSVRCAALLALVSLAACDATTAPVVTPELSCLNAVIAPDRYAIPHRYTDSIPLVVSKVGDRDYGKTIAWLVFGDPIEQKRCLTLADSIWIFVPQK